MAKTPHEARHEKELIGAEKGALLPVGTQASQAQHLHPDQWSPGQGAQHTLYREGLGLQAFSGAWGPRGPCTRKSKQGTLGDGTATPKTPPYSKKGQQPNSWKQDLSWAVKRERNPMGI